MLVADENLCSRHGTTKGNLRVFAKQFFGHTYRGHGHGALRWAISIPEGHIGEPIEKRSGEPPRKRLSAEYKTLQFREEVPPEFCVRSAERGERRCRNPGCRLRLREQSE